MEKFLEYITLNYTWFLGGSIIILLAVIGYYADKTNFGQGKPKEIEKENKPEGEKLDASKRLNDLFPQKGDKDNQKLEVNNNQNLNVQQPNIVSQMNFDPMTGQPINQNNQTSIDVNQSNQFINSNNNLNTPIVEDSFDDIGTLKTSEENFQKFDKEFNELLPKKEIIDDELLDEINNLSLDKTQKIELSDIPDLDDVELPKIKSLTEEEDIWNF